jgi:hypothetical protein
MQKQGKDRYVFPLFFNLGKGLELIWFKREYGQTYCDYGVFDGGYKPIATNLFYAILNLYKKGRYNK